MLIYLIFFAIIIFIFRNKIDKQLHRFDWYSNYKFSLAQKKIQKQIAVKNVDRNLLIADLVKEVRRLRNIYGISKYIPHDHKSVDEIREYIDKNFGTAMREHGVTLTKKLKINA